MKHNLFWLILFYALTYNSRIAFSTVMGPIIIDIIGYEPKSNAIYFAKSDWRETGNATELYTYYIDRDSLGITKWWCDNYVYEKHRDSILKVNELDTLKKMYKVDGMDIFSFAWLNKQRTFSPVFDKDTTIYPFKIMIGNKSYPYKVCYNQSIPEFKTYAISNTMGIIIMNYKYDCFEGNMGDEIFFFKKSSENTFSRVLDK